MKKLLMITILLFIFIACENKPETSKKSWHPIKYDALPANVSNLTDMGNGWCTFELDTFKFLYHKQYTTVGGYGFEAITQIK